MKLYKGLKTSLIEREPLLVVLFFLYLNIMPNIIIIIDEWLRLRMTLHSEVKIVIYR